MGYDLIGCNPKECCEDDYPLVVKWHHKSWKEKKAEMSDEELDQYQEEWRKKEIETGSYFRANIWW